MSELAIGVSDELLVADAIAAREAAEATEAEASPSRWREADNYAELNRRGWSTRRIAESCGTSKSAVGRCIQIVSRYRDSDERPSFWHAYAEVTGEREKGESDGAHVGNNSGDNEWYTPADYIEAARVVMGGVDLDPASSPEANEVVGAAVFYTERDDGRLKKWEGRVWMNPPYARPLIDEFCAKLAESYASGDVSAACVLVNNATETGWFHALAEVAGAFCFPRHRVKFWHPRKEATPLQGQAVIYLGPDVAVFRREFVRFGITAAL